MNGIIRKRLANGKRRIRRRLRKTHWSDQPKPMFSASNIHYEIAERVRAIAAGGIGAIHLLARRTGLIDALDQNLHLLKQHKPYHESDHVLNIVYNLLAGGTRLEHIKPRRHDEVYMDALGAQRIPDPTTAGDFCRRFTTERIETLIETINEIRLRVWREQPEEFFEKAVIDVDGTIAETTGECKQGMDIAYNGKWGFHPLVVSLANTGEPLYLLNRSGSRPSHEGAAYCLDRSIRLCRRAGFKKITMRGDCDFTQTTHLDRWDRQNARFIFGIAVMKNLVEIIENLPKKAFRPLVRKPKYEVRTEPRQRPENFKEQAVIEREFENIRLLGEEVAEFAYQPTTCKKAYRVIVVQKTLSHTRGQQWLFDSQRPFLYITNDWETPADEIVFEANGRSNQENLIKQLKSGVHAMDMPVDNLVSNWAYMVMASLAWTLKAWAALLLPETGRWADKHKSEKQALLRMDFKTFLNAFIQMPAQIIRGAGKIIYRLLSWNPWQPVFFRLVKRLRYPLRC